MARGMKPSRKPTKTTVKAAADRAERRAKGEPVESTPDPVLNPPETKRKRGRPSKYDPAFCELVMDLGEQGKSRTQIARTLGTTRQRLLEWEQAHPEFRDALACAADLAQAWWEDQGQLGINLGKDFNAATFQFMMKNRFKADYSEKFEIKHDATVEFSKCWQAIGSGSVPGTGVAA